MGICGPLLAYCPSLLSHFPTGLLAFFPSFPLSTSLVPVMLCRTRGSPGDPAGNKPPAFGVWPRLSASLGQFFQKISARSKNCFGGIAPKRPKKQNKSTLGGPVSEKGSKKSAAPRLGCAWRVKVRMKSTKYGMKSTPLPPSMPKKLSFDAKG